MQRQHENRVGLHRPKGSLWRAALNVLAMPAMRVHNYRNLNTAMIRDALCFVEKCHPDAEKRK